MANKELSDRTEPTAEEMAAKALDDLRASQRSHALLHATVPYGVDFSTETFYFGSDTPHESSWEIAGDWVYQKDRGIVIKSIWVFPSRTVVDGAGDRLEREERSVPGHGLDREIMRQLGSSAPIRKEIERQVKVQRPRLADAVAQGVKLRDWAHELIEAAQRLDESPRPRRTGKPLEWWVERADEYLAVTQKLGRKYGAQEQLADDKETEDYWGVGTAGTRWRLKRLRELGLIEDAGPSPRPGPNHPEATPRHAPGA